MLRTPSADDGDTRYHSVMTEALPFTHEAVGEALRRRNIDLDPDEFLGVLGDIVSTTATLSAGEQEFLTRAGAAPEVFESDAVNKASLRLAVLTEHGDMQAAQGLTTRDVAQVLNTQPANVRRLLAARSLYTSGRAARSEHIFPRWQFVGSQALPHLRKILDVLPQDMHPLDVESFMTEPREPLGNRSPVDWLATGGQPGPAVALAEEESWS